MSVLILASGAVTSVGHSVAQCDLSIRAGINRRRQTGLEGERGPIFAAPVLPIGDDLMGVDRGLRMLAPTLDECLSDVRPIGRSGLVSCVANHGFFGAMVGFPESQRLRCQTLMDSWRELTPRVFDTLRRRGLTMTADHVLEIAKGQPSAMEGLIVASEWLQRGEVDHVFLAAIASQCDRAFLEAFDRLGVVSRPAAVGGHVPSEGAVVLLLGRTEPLPTTSIVARSFHVNRGSSATGDALTEVLEAAMSEPGAELAHELLTDVNGERWRANEMSIATLRCVSFRDIPLTRLDVARSTGELGAAGGALGFALCHHAVRRDGRTRVIASSTRGPSRGAAIVSRSA